MSYSSYTFIYYIIGTVVHRWSSEILFCYHQEIVGKCVANGRKNPDVQRTCTDVLHWESGLIHIYFIHIKHSYVVQMTRIIFIYIYVLFKWLRIIGSDKVHVTTGMFREPDCYWSFEIDTDISILYSNIDLTKNSWNINWSVMVKLFLNDLKLIFCIFVLQFFVNYHLTYSICQYQYTVSVIRWYHPCRYIRWERWRVYEKGQNLKGRESKMENK